MVCDLRHCTILMMPATKGCYHDGCNHCRNTLIASCIFSWDDVDDMEEEIKINQKLKELKLEWKENVQLEKTKRGPYMKGKTPKSTYYDKYGPSGSFTKAAAGNEKITSLFKVQT